MRAELSQSKKETSFYMKQVRDAAEGRPRWRWGVAGAWGGRTLRQEQGKEPIEAGRVRP